MSACVNARSVCVRTFPRRSEEHTSELQSLRHLVCRLLLEKKKKKKTHSTTRPELRRDSTESQNTPKPPSRYQVRHNQPGRKHTRQSTHRTELRPHIHTAQR